MPFTTDQLPSTAKYTSSRVPSSLGSRAPTSSSPPSHQLNTMDKKTLKWSRRIIRLAPTFPAAVLSSPHMLKLPMPSDAIQTSQHQCFWRGQHRGPRQAAVTNRLLQRALRQQAIYTNNPHAATPIAASSGSADGPLWAHTTAKIYADTGLFI